MSGSLPQQWHVRIAFTVASMVTVDIEFQTRKEPNGQKSIRRHNLLVCSSGASSHWSMPLSVLPSLSSTLLSLSSSSMLALSLALALALAPSLEGPALPILPATPVGQK